jgi:sterol desaturase/sphingolipid hydroxylase (fatty acid hydroxylase superfamily)
MPIVAEGMSYDWGKDIEILKAVSTGVAGITNPFENLFKNNLQTIIMWIIIVCIIIVIIIVSIILFRYLYSHCQARTLAVT